MVGFGVEEEDKDVPLVINNNILVEIRLKKGS